MALQTESNRIISQFLAKTLHAILAARIPHLHDAAARGGGAAAPRHRRRDRWFQLALGDPPPPIEHGGLLPHGVLEPLVVDIVLSPRDASASAAAAEPVVERWTAQCESAPPAPADAASSSFVVRRTYKKSIILLRSLYSLLRLLPAYRFFRMMCASHQSYNYDLSYRVSSFAAPFSREEEKGFALHSFAPVETQFGNLLVSVQYRPTLADFNLEVSSLSPPMLIADYVGSPATDPMRAFPASPAERGGAPPRPSTSAPPLFQRPHSWTSAPIPHHPLGIGGASPIPVADQRLSLPESYDPRLPSQQAAASALRKGGFSFDEFKLSPPFSSSTTPSPPTFGGANMQFRLPSETAPVSIPQAASWKSQALRGPNLSDPTRNFLPPPSPRSTRADHSAQEYPSGSRSFRKSEGLKTADLFSNLYAVQKGLKESRDDSGRFSGVFSSGGSPRFGFSRSSSRLSIQDDDDADYSYPFAVDDVDISDSQTRSNDGKETSEYSQAYASSHRSQDAAVGVLVHMLRTAPPLRDQSYSSQSSKSELNGDSGVTSSFFMSRKTSDALEELQTYKEMKEILLSQSRGQLEDPLKQRTE
ncbi:Autophagy-related protein 13 [Ananas comosus]|uniref:Autophagy-related protein 13 n=1 Tax=Ananas comosus TaxID=4615 RepID=A0A199UTS5_ANACO|nr:Autophagy-related protein 13 [Ananas comosus]